MRYLLEEAGADPDLAMADGKLAVFWGVAWRAGAGQEKITRVC